MPHPPFPAGVLGSLAVPLGLGLLRLSTEGRPSWGDSVALIHLALDRGIRVLDTADSYALADADFHYGERLAREAVTTWTGPRDEVRIITKAGLSRPKGKWIPNARPAHLRKSVEGSVAALGGPIFLLLLHANDPKTPFEDSLRTLAELQQAGLVQHLGLCNVSIPEVRQAQRHFPVCAIQNELSVMDRSSATEGLVELARQLGIPFLAHRPLGGHAKTVGLLKNRAMKPLAVRLKCTPHEAALAVLLDLGAPVLPLIGATKRESLESSLHALDLRLDGAARDELATKISLVPTPEAVAELVPPLVPAGLRELHAGEEPGTEPEVVIVMGVQGAGKSSQVARYETKGYARLNRDQLGGKLEDLVPQLGAMLDAGTTRVILDNTYATRVSRYPVIRAAHACAIPVRCIHLATPIREAYVNVIHRILERYDQLPGPEELKEWSKTDPNLPPPAALARWAASFEPPALDEGFGVVEEVPFVRRPAPERQVRGLLLDVDGTIRRTISGEIYPRTPEDVELIPGRREVLQRWIADGYRLFFVSNQSGVASEHVSRVAVEAAFARTIELLDLPVDEVAFCPHPAFPTGCFCRKPLPGLGLRLISRHGLSAEHLIMVGDMESDARFAEAIGASYHDAADFFKGS